MTDAVIGILIPFAGTTLGAACVFFLKRGLSLRWQRFTMGLASGVMIAASVWSLLIPSVEMAREQGQVPWLPALAGFLLGIAFLLIIDIFVPTPSVTEQNGDRGRSMLCFAVTLHNLPEGMAVGVAFAGVLHGQYGVALTGAYALAVGIALQNIPEGAVISLPMTAAGYGRRRAFSYGFLSGIVEPVGAAVTLLLTSLITPILPYILAFAAGAMMYVVTQELIPQACEKDRGHIGTVGAGIGFAIMMLLDVALS